MGDGKCEGGHTKSTPFEEVCEITKHHGQIGRGVTKHHAQVGEGGVANNIVSSAQIQ